MKKVILLALLACSQLISTAQFKESLPPTNYRATTTATHKLVHTKLDVRFDFPKAHLIGKEWLTLQPYYYPSNTVRLDAQGMEIKKVALVDGTQQTELKYQYDGNQLHIDLPKVFQSNDKFTLYFEYISKPDELKTKGSDAITDAKGLYFINPRQDDPYKPIQIWTQGETTANSVWFITIDHPNQFTTQELTMTVPDSFVTLSNGLMVAQKKNNDGTRSDTWKLDIPHAPYLFFMGAGVFEVIKDKPFKGKEISYYVEKQWAPYAKEIFGNTADMIQFYEDYTGVPFIWPKYAQIVGRDYVSGAMENSTAVIHQYNAYQNNRELADLNRWEETIAHEIFHHWFGDLITMESWSNLPMNESFANYSEYLWFRYKYGNDRAEEHAFNDKQAYFSGNNANKDLIRFYFNDKEDMFDHVSYNKGGKILHMLSYFVGEDAFRAGLKKLLTDRKHQNVEATHLRLALEEVTGRDLNWFFNQWFYGAGHPVLTFDYLFDDNAAKVKVIVRQTQKGNAFTLPMEIDVYYGKEKQTHQRWVTSKIDTLVFDYKSGRPSLIIMDPNSVILAEKTDNKPESYYIEQWNHKLSYEHRRAAIEYYAKNDLPEIAKGLIDQFGGIRKFTIEEIDKTPYKDDKVVLKAIEGIAQKDLNKLSKAAAIAFLANKKESQYLPILNANLNDVSYTVAGESLNGIYLLDKATGIDLARKQAVDAKGVLGEVCLKILLTEMKESDFDVITNIYHEMPLSNEKFEYLVVYVKYISGLNDEAKLKRGVDEAFNVRGMIPSAYRGMIDEFLKEALQPISNKSADLRKYIESRF